MFLSELLEYLSYGELAGLAVGGLGKGGVSPKDYPRIISNINLGLIELYTKFPLKTAQVNLQLYEHIALYTLHTDYASTNLASVQPYKYINDSVTDPFTNDILVIDSVFSEVGDEYPINEGKEKYSIFTPSYNTIQIPFSEDGNTVDIVYRASPTLVETTVSNPSEVWVPFPNNLLECLIAFVLHKIYSSIGGDSKNAGMYYNKYKELLAIAQHIGLVIVENNLNEKLDNGGWV